MIANKDERRDFHKHVRELFNGKLATEARKLDEDEQQQVIDIVWSSGNARASEGILISNAIFSCADMLKCFTDRKPKYVDGNPPYIHFTMQKWNKETQDALTRIGSLLKVSPRDLGTAGTKDKRAVTTQRVSLKRGRKTADDVWKVLNGPVARPSRGRGGRGRGGFRGGRGDDALVGIRVGNFTYEKTPLELGMLQGNRFTITLRDVKVDSLDTVDRAAQVVREHGFINYFVRDCTS